ncbi:pyrimidine dimer DNA glycosylase/endonuclease V [Leucobacter sp. wl10]|uniref:pyrimidine dimer DNA glycosylase/endonuclease V n=1 Tax=Leucobacter sp. wl10 TaxID=2304677 RepID=UPI000E5BB92E|nr:pyrimidine dimer DNA glycosylase/endonuclease V [Leucobacter sp. wl10]RGE20401.1 hypothetical protein D1J51_09495 [Leucobacter sp. wl10]
MRLWSLHPGHLDRIGLVACWREALLAQAVLDGRTIGYRNHPQLVRFGAAPHPLGSIGAYLAGLHDEATSRGYRFDGDKILVRVDTPPRLAVTQGQLEFEWRHLGRKLAERSEGDAARWRRSAPAAHPLFAVEPGDVEGWERV